jgi:hypothetical protein
MMKNGLKAFSFLMLMVAVVFVSTGCGKKGAGPKDADVTSAITSAIESDSNAGTLKSPVVILERGAKVGEEFPFKVEYTVAAADGSSKKETVHYVLMSSINDMGATVWTATKK